MIRFTCPRCDAALRVADDRAGEKVKCPRCGRPASAPESLDDTPAAELDEGPRGMPAWAWAVVAAGVLVLVVVAAVLITRSGRGSVDPGSPTAGAQADLATDEGRTRWLVGEWEQKEESGERYDYRFEAGGRYRVTVRPKGRPEGWMSGMWYFEGGRLHVTVRDTSEGAPARVQQKTFEVRGASADRFTLINTGNGNGGLLVRKK